MPVSEVASADVLEILTPLWHTKAATAHVVQNKVEAAYMRTDLSSGGVGS